jgi:hypothetical protein
MNKPIKLVDLSPLTDEQRAALSQLVKDANKAAPQIIAAGETALAVWQQWLRSPAWSIVESPPPDEDQRPREGWDIGAPQVNYDVERPPT